MSTAGAQMDKIEVIAEAAIAGLTVTRKLRASSDLIPEAVPHMFLHTPSGAVSLLALAQEGVTRTVRADFVFRDTLENSLLAFEAFVAALRADRRLSDTVDSAYVSLHQTLEHSQSGGVIIESVIALETVES